MREHSPFGEHFKQFGCIADMDKSPTNQHYAQMALRQVESRWLPLYPLWGCAVLQGTELVTKGITNAPVESWFRWVKTSIHSGSKGTRLKLSRFAREQFNIVKNRLARVATELAQTVLAPKNPRGRRGRPRKTAQKTDIRAAHDNRGDGWSRKKVTHNHRATGSGYYYAASRMPPIIPRDNSDELVVEVYLEDNTVTSANQRAAATGVAASSADVQCLVPRLFNIGNTCWANSAFTAVAHFRLARSLPLSRPPQQEDPRDNCMAAIAAAVRHLANAAVDSHHLVAKAIEEMQLLKRSTIGHTQDAGDACGLLVESIVWALA